MSNIAEISSILSIVTPMAVALIGLRAEKFQKESKRIKELEYELDMVEKEKMEEQFKSIHTGIDTLQNDVKSIQGELNGLKIANNEQDSLIKSITALNKTNANCTNELAQLVMALAEGMRDEHLDGNITQAVIKYRNFETAILNSLITK